MATVYEVRRAGRCSHRFRQALATEVLELCGSIEEAADILCDSPPIIQKHYAKWTACRTGPNQRAFEAALARVRHTNLGRPEAQGNERDGMVDGMGFEPTTPALRTPCSPN